MVHFSTLIDIVLDSLCEHVLVDKEGISRVTFRFILQQHGRLDKLGVIDILIGRNDRFRRA